MKNFYIICFLFINTLTLRAQDSKNTADLFFLSKAIQKLPSYKDQIKTNPKIDVTFLDTIAFSGKESTFKVFMTLYQLIAPIKDNHLAFYTNRDSVFAKSDVFEIPKTIMDFARQDSKSDSVCGTYHMGVYELRLVKIGAEFVGAIENEGKYYTQFILKPITPDHFDMIGFAKGGGAYYLNRNVVYSNKRLAGTPYTKQKETSFASLAKNTPKFQFKVIDSNIGYLRLGSFASDNRNIAESTKFYEQLNLPKNIGHLIVDLRDNGGGGYKTSKKFLDLVRHFDGQVHVVVNVNTVSNAEQFTIDVMDLKNVTLYGETTRGTICYGNNMDTVVDLPSKRFSFYVTDMTARTKDIPFESYGITPKFKLDPFQKDWIDQVIDHIKNK